MDYIYIGEIVNTHGLKGELKLRSDFKFKQSVFKDGFKLYINNKKEEVKIHKHRKFKNFDLVTFENHLDINDVLGYKSEKIYANKDDILLEDNEYLNEDLIGLQCFIGTKYIGKIEDIINNKASDIFVIDNEMMIPYVDEFVSEIDLPNNKIIINNMEGLM